MSIDHENSDSEVEGTSAWSYEEFFQTVKRGEAKVIAVRDLISMWGYKRRGSTLVHVIEKEMQKRGLVSIPNITSADYYGDVKILDRRDENSQEDPIIGWPISSVLDENAVIVGVTPEVLLGEIETVMVMKNYSQIPVFRRRNRDLLGSITWRSIARWRGDRKSAAAKEVMSPGGYVAKSSDPLLMHIPAIIENEFIYIESPSGEVVGILTATDLAESFLETSGPFIKIGEIEQRIRRLVDRLTVPEIQKAKHADDANREVHGVDDLSFGEYVRALENPARWISVDAGFERGPIIENLKDVNNTRNDVMHFRPRPLELEKAKALDWCLNWLREIG